MIIRTLSVGRPVPLAGTDVRSAIYKQPVDGPVFLSKTGLAGDEQADLQHHGGPDKACCVYSGNHYAYWEQTLSVPLPPAAFGENLTVDGLTESDALIGDVFQVGGAVVQVCQPRIPCFKVGRKFGRDDMAERMMDTGFTGFYLRVLQEGPVQAGDRFVLKERDPEAPSVAFANHIRYHEPNNRLAMELLVRTAAFAPAWLIGIHKRLNA